ncbi:hypothetical protein ACFPZ0_21000 [Streptomonospora nanhaiensis]|uniref:Uncharacterized protein n=1 Tax=Streptomonospora nanhaiensis TaxID=1323731 RepID=A0A853BUI7_9ACTN|nr:hypothetical protein [Streptomonospora nanhaiensis]MBV2367167.1 hypothetical protein [Streptomonospora nanhaiensis]MBX9390569.1 hypothetical protein [Streptomonospora nanhaiensis]NYI98177.1 hypothetical protein [Streptomonospora nanhaiensis]
MLTSVTWRAVRSAARGLLAGAAWLCPLVLPLEAAPAAGPAGPRASGARIHLDPARVDERWAELMRRELPTW